MEKSRRETIKDRKRTYRKLNKDPIEIPIGRRTIPDTREMVRQYVHQALEQSGATHGYEDVDEMIREETDLEPEDPDPAWASQYEVTEMEEIAPLEEAPQEEGEQTPDPPPSDEQAENENPA